MELRQLRYFVAVAEELHFRRAAERLHMSQPPLSTAIRALEQDIGVELLLRSRRRVELTPAGAAFLTEARRILESVESAADVARRVGRGELGRLSIGFVGSAMYGRLPDILRVFRAERPDVALSLSELTTARQLEALKSHTIDVGVLRPPSALDEGIRTETLVTERVAVALPSAHPLARSRRVELSDLVDEPLVLLDRREAPGLRESIRKAVLEAGGEAHVVQEVTEMQTLIGLVAAGLGISFVPRSVAVRGYRGVAFVSLGGLAPVVELALAWTTDSPPLEAFLNTARTALY